ncbi:MULTISPECIES: hypothetical protein [Methylomonas]|uniref:Uncharacterized protein n=2 Tax=Methylomonas TaxID=416 RepID=A0A126T7W3_9GAMM|nr:MULTISPECIES: hypothetical protein [Methylomonas]AMK78161.1 hypothetical protein JT25_017005 [Methylomonas denitrificans]OAI03884.1 hypothetical protein A1342_04940 [Methylomonas methanica]TCV87811.1 hypothetical protein EDE11_102316 [Methylomonas methanica]
MATEFSNQQIDQPIVIADVMNGQTIAMLQPVYPLTEADFVRLEGRPPITSAGAAMIFSGVVGYAIGLGPKLESIITGQEPILNNGEVKTIASWSAIALLFYLFGLFLPNQRTNIMKKLSSHFKATKSSTHVIGGGK